MNGNDDPRYPTWLKLVFEPSDIPAPVRLRRALKTLLRVYGIRCVKVQIVEPEKEQPCSTS